jgi:hypothetical protein
MMAPSGNRLTEKKMLLALSLLSSIAAQWLRAASSLSRRLRT